METKESIQNEIETLERENANIWQRVYALNEKLDAYRRQELIEFITGKPFVVSGNTKKIILTNTKYKSDQLQVFTGRLYHFRYSYPEYGISISIDDDDIIISGDLSIKVIEFAKKFGLVLKTQGISAKITALKESLEDYNSLLEWLEKK